MDNLIKMNIGLYDMSRYVHFKLDPDEIKVKAFFLSQKNLEYASLIDILVKLDAHFENQPLLNFQSPTILIDLDLYAKDQGDLFTKKRFQTLRTMYYMDTCHYSTELIHWLIAEREYLQESIENRKNIINEES